MGSAMRATSRGRAGWALIDVPWSALVGQAAGDGAGFRRDEDDEDEDEDWGGHEDPVEGQ